MKKFDYVRWGKLTTAWFLVVSQMQNCVTQSSSVYQCVCLSICLSVCLSLSLTLLLSHSLSLSLSRSVSDTETLWGGGGGPWGDRWVMHHLRRLTSRKNQKDITFNGLKGAVSLYTKANCHKSRALSIQRPIDGQTDQQTDQPTEWLIELRARN